jgi:hypothetical protein
MTYTVTFVHGHSIASAPVYEAATKDEAKETGDREFGDGSNDVEIRVYDRHGNLAAFRRADDPQWHDC